MTVTLKAMIGRLPVKERKAIDVRTAELIAGELTLRDLRQALHLTQDSVAGQLGIGQEGVSRLEKRSDLLISTLQGYVEALGGKLRLTAEFPGRPPIHLSGLAVLETPNLAVPHSRSRKSGVKAGKQVKR